MNRLTAALPSSSKVSPSFGAQSYRNMSSCFKQEIIWLGKKNADWRTAQTIKKFIDEKTFKLSYRTPKMFAIESDWLFKERIPLVVVPPPAHSKPTIFVHPKIIKVLNNYLLSGGNVWVPWEDPSVLGSGLLPPVQILDKTRVIPAGTPLSSNLEAKVHHFACSYIDIYPEEKVSVIGNPRNKICLDGEVLASTGSQPSVVLKKMGEEGGYILATNRSIDVTSEEIPDNLISIKMHLKEDDEKRTLLFAKILKDMGISLNKELQSKVDSD